MILSVCCIWAGRYGDVISWISPSSSSAEDNPYRATVPRLTHPHPSSLPPMWVDCGLPSSLPRPLPPAERLFLQKVGQWQSVVPVTHCWSDSLSVWANVLRVDVWCEKITCALCRCVIPHLIILTWDVDVFPPRAYRNRRSIAPTPPSSLPRSLTSP